MPKISFVDSINFAMAKAMTKDKQDDMLWSWSY